MTTNSLVFTPEEAKYLKAVLRWKDDSSLSDNISHLRPRQTPNNFTHPRKQPPKPQEKPAGEFRVLVVGGRGTGKTSVLTRFTQNIFPLAPSSAATKTASYRQTVSLSSPSSPPTSPSASSTPLQNLYTIDALEFPSQHLLSNPLLEQALAITDAAVLLYSVADSASFRLARGISDFIREYFSQPQNSSRVYGLLLVGNKSDLMSATVGPGEGEESEREREREVTYPEGSKAATKMGIQDGGTGIGFLETSCKTGENIEEVFPAVGREVLRLRRLRSQQQQQQQQQQQVDKEEMRVRFGEMERSRKGSSGGGDGKSVKKAGGLLRRMVPFWRRGSTSTTVGGEKAF
ncbi:ras-related and estrogen-regulated growth inhibitor-like protein [Cladorrhinum sp. PSN259]|nr:ras-related and estrogen-regulated growth inhibitor-like protein [Cladorrhinum sp. PSN259]